MKRWILSRALGLALIAAVALLVPSNSPESYTLLAQTGNCEVVDGWTGDLDWRLLADGTAVNLTGMTVTMVLFDDNGVAVDTTGDISVPDAANGKVRYAPDSTDLVVANSPLTFRFKVVDGASKTVYFPSARAATCVVHPV